MEKNLDLSQPAALTYAYLRLLAGGNEAAQQVAHLLAFDGVPRRIPLEAYMKRFAWWGWDQEDDAIAAAVAQVAFKAAERYLKVAKDTDELDELRVGGVRFPKTLSDWEQEGDGEPTSGGTTSEILKTGLTMRTFKHLWELLMLWHMS